MDAPLTAFVTAVLRAVGDADARQACAQLAERLAGRIEHAEEDTEDRWRVVVRVDRPEWVDGHSASAYERVIRTVLDEFGVPHDSAELAITPPTAHVVVPADHVSALGPGIEWVLVEVWEAGESQSAEVEDLDGGGPDLDPPEIAELADAVSRTYVGVTADVRDHDEAAARELVQDVAERITGSGEALAITGLHEPGGGVVRIDIHLGGSDAEPEEAVATAIDRIAGLVPKDGWEVTHDGPAVRAVWSDDRSRHTRGVVRLELVAGPALSGAS